MEVFSEAGFSSAHLDQERAEASREFVVEFEYSAGGFSASFRSSLPCVIVHKSGGIPVNSPI